MSQRQELTRRKRSWLCALAALSLTQLAGCMTPTSPVHELIYSTVDGALLRPSWVRSSSDRIVKFREFLLLVASPCYSGVLGAALLFDIPVVAIPEENLVPSSDVLQRVVRSERENGRRPRALYVMPDHANPSGRTMSLAERTWLLDAAAALNILVIEDTPYRLVSGGARLPTLKALDERVVVIHLGSFSKSGYPGARVGFAVADQRVESAPGDAVTLLADELTKAKSMITVNTSSLGQAAMAGLLLEAGGRLQTHNDDVSRQYLRRRKVMLRALERRLGGDRAASGLRWSRPTGGFFVCLEVPFPADQAAVLRSARDWGVIWTPMSYFYPDRDAGKYGMRLAFSGLDETEIEEGIDRLAGFIQIEWKRSH